MGPKKPNKNRYAYAAKSNVDSFPSFLSTEDLDDQWNIGGGGHNRSRSHSGHSESSKYGSSRHNRSNSHTESYGSYGSNSRTKFYGSYGPSSSKAKKLPTSRNRAHTISHNDRPKSTASGITNKIRNEHKELNHKQTVFFQNVSIGLKSFFNGLFAINSGFVERQLTKKEDAFELTTSVVSEIAGQFPILGLVVKGGAKSVSFAWDIKENNALVKLANAPVLGLANIENTRREVALQLAQKFETTLQEAQDKQIKSLAEKAVKLLMNNLKEYSTAEKLTSQMVDYAIKHSEEIFGKQSLSSLSYN